MQPHAQQSTLGNKQSCKYVLNGFLNPLLLWKPGGLRSVLFLSLQTAYFYNEYFLIMNCFYANIQVAAQIRQSCRAQGQDCVCPQGG